MTKLPLNRLISSCVTPSLAALRLTPNQVTLLSLAAGSLAAWSFFQGNSTAWMLGAFLLQASYVLDNCDGELARMTGQVSGLGSWLDFVSDCFIHTAFFFSLGWGLHRRTLDPSWVGLGVIASAAVFLTYLTSFLTQVRERGEEALRHPDPPMEEQTGDFLRRLHTVLRGDFSLVVVIFALASRMEWILWGGVLGASFYWIASSISLALRWRRVAS